MKGYPLLEQWAVGGRREMADGERWRLDLGAESASSASRGVVKHDKTPLATGQRHEMSSNTTKHCSPQHHEVSSNTTTPLRLAYTTVTTQGKRSSLLSSPTMRSNAKWVLLPHSLFPMASDHVHSSILPPSQNALLLSGDADSDFFCVPPFLSFSTTQ